MFERMDGLAQAQIMHTSLPIAGHNLKGNKASTKRFQYIDHGCSWGRAARSGLIK